MIYATCFHASKYYFFELIDAVSNASVNTNEKVSKLSFVRVSVLVQDTYGSGQHKANGAKITFAHELVSNISRALFEVHHEVELHLSFDAWLRHDHCVSLNVNRTSITDNVPFTSVYYILPDL